LNEIIYSFKLKKIACHMFAKAYICKQADAKLISFHSSAKTVGEKRLIS